MLGATVRNVGAAESILLLCQCGLYKSTSSFNDNLLGNDRLCKLPPLPVVAGNSRAAPLKGFICEWLSNGECFWVRDGFMCPPLLSALAPAPAMDLSRPHACSSVHLRLEHVDLEQCFSACRLGPLGWWWWKLNNPFTPFTGVAYHISCIAGIYIVIHISCKITVMKQEQK